MELTSDLLVEQFMLKQIAQPVIEEVSKIILNKVRESIEENTYRGEATFYLYGWAKPSREFINAFKWEDFETSTKKIVANLVYDWQSMDYDGERGAYKHGNRFTSGDVREYLDEILDVNGYTSSHWLARRVKPYWKKAINELFDKRRIDIEIKKVTIRLSSSLGVKIKKVF